MSLELVNTFGTLLTVAIIGATAIAAIVQLRHLRAGNQINAMLSIGNQFDDKVFSDAHLLVHNKGASALEDPLYRAYVLALKHNQQLPAVPEEYVQVRRAILRIANTYEELGILVKNGIVDKRLFLDRYSSAIAGHWDALEGHVAYSRAVDGDDRVWENFEYLTVLAQDFERENPSAYPVGVRRLSPKNLWPVPPLAAVTTM